MKKAILVLLVCLSVRPASAIATDELMALVAMPLTVAAVSEIESVPKEPLFDLISLLLEARVPAAQFIEIVRYAPVALVDPAAERDFVRYVRDRTGEGLRGGELTSAIETEFRSYEPSGIELTVRAPREDYFEARSLIPALVVTRLATRNSHPHGGPPGQLKKQAGLQTGAEVVHGRIRDRVRPFEKEERKARGKSPGELRRGKNEFRGADQRPERREWKENRGSDKAARSKGNGNGGRNGKGKNKG